MFDKKSLKTCNAIVPRTRLQSALHKVPATQTRQRTPLLEILLSTPNSRTLYPRKSECQHT
jgi:hypothetical protein